MTATTDRTPPPMYLPLIVENLPLEDLAPYPHFVDWKPEWRPGKNGKPGGWTKVPKNPRTGANAQSNNPASWGFFHGLPLHPDRGADNHVGYVVADDDPFTFADVDNGIDAAGQIKPWARDIVNALPTAYWERSTTGTGLKGLVRGGVPRNRIVPIGDGKLELFSSGKFTALTGHRLEGTSPTIGEGQAALDALYAELCPESAPQPIVPRPELDADDQTIIERVRRSAKGRRLYDDGDWSGDYPSQSEGDSALCWSIRRAGASCEEQVDRIFRSSALMRDKWDKQPSYARDTVADAFAMVEPWEGWAPAATISSTTQRPTEPTSDPCGPVRDELAELRAENARLRAELEQTRQELTQTRRDLSAVIKVIGNPNLGGDAAGKALVLAATHVQWQRARVHSDDGYYRVTASKVADNREWVDGEDGERIPVPAPAQVSPRTVTKYMAIAQERGLIPAEKRTIRVPKGEHDFPVDVWHWKAAPTLADQLAPLTGGTVYDEDNPRPIRGGDPKQRRLAPIPGCPECGNHQVACVACAAIFNAPAAIDLDTGETLTANEADQELEERRHTVPTRGRRTRTVVTGNGATSLQSAPAGAPRPPVPRELSSRERRAFEDLQAREREPREGPESPVSDAGTVGRPEKQPLPGLDAAPLDHRTDGAYGARA